jgi:hypothetical protein
VTAYRLDPIPTGRNDPRWEASHLQELVWAGATSPEDARKLVALKTLTFTPTHPGRPILLSPWYDDKLATCVLDTGKVDVPEGVVIRGDGSPV